MSKSRARDQAKRARNFDSLLQRAYRKSEPIRVVVLEGVAREQAELGWDTSTVRYRSLDPEVWYVHSYSDDDGSFRLVRGIPAISNPTANNESATPPFFVDQFSLPEVPQRREIVGSAFVRSQEVGQTVLRRAAGICEYCGALGFETAAGAIYIETHHVIPLSENGPDVVWNIVAICPSDHRRAHFGKDRDSIRETLVAKMVSIYRTAQPLFSDLLTRQEH